MLNVELPKGLKGASLIQHSTLNIKKTKGPVRYLNGSTCR